MYPQSVGREQERKRNAEGQLNWRQGLPPENSGRWEVRRGEPSSRARTRRRAQMDFRTRYGGSWASLAWTFCGAPCP
eukprot:3605576-Heterocapsa_arctica.AAC.1